MVPYMRLLLFCFTFIMAATGMAQAPGGGSTIILRVVDTSPGPMKRPFVVEATVPLMYRNGLMDISKRRLETVSGIVRIDSLPAGDVDFRIRCTVIERHSNDVRGTLHFSLPAHSELDTAVVVSHSGCYAEPIHAERHSYTGIYTVTFEGSGFAPCKNDASYPSRTHLESEGLLPGAPIKREIAAYFVRVGGVVRGPGAYGRHASPYLFAVDSVFSVAKVPFPANCAALLKDRALQHARR